MLILQIPITATSPNTGCIYKSEVKSKGELTATKEQKIEWEL